VRKPEDIIINRRTFELRVTDSRNDLREVWGGRGRMTVAEILDNRAGKPYVWMRHLFTEWAIEWTGVISGGTEFVKYFKYIIVDGRMHAEDQPAIAFEYSDGWYSREWRFHGVLHRKDGPAKISPNCDKWYIHGINERRDGPSTITYQCDPQWNRIRARKHYYIGHPTKSGCFRLDENGDEITVAERDEIPF